MTLFTGTISGLEMRRDIVQYVSRCHICIRTRTNVDRRQPQGWLKILQVPHLPFEIISTDEMRGFPTINGLDAIMLV